LKENASDLQKGNSGENILKDASELTNAEASLSDNQFGVNIINACIYWYTASMKSDRPFQNNGHFFYQYPPILFKIQKIIIFIDIKQANS